VSTVRRSFQ
ncbi:hypothetical protein H8Z86_17510, partial [Bacillus licheniformis]